MLIFAGTAIWSLTMVKSGLVYNFGMGFWGPNGHDGVWHIALINQLAEGRWIVPVFSGNSLQNYHVGFDLLVALLHRISGIPIVNLYFQVIPPILALLIGLLTYKFVLLWRKDRKGALWATFFVYFAGSWGWVVTLLRDGGIGGESMFWAQQSISTLVNPPYALSLVFLLGGLIAVVKYLEKPTLPRFLYSILLLGLLIQIKAYAGVLTLGGLFVSGLFLFQRDKESGLFKIFAGTLAVSLVIFFPFNKTGASLFIYQPFWFLETLMAASDRFYWPKLAEAMLSYKYQKVYSRFFLAYGFSFLLFLFGNIGTRVLGAYFPIKNLGKKMDWRLVFTGSVVAAGLLIPLFFLQKGTPWNTIQFSYYSLFFLSVLAGISAPAILAKAGKNKKLMAFLVVALTLPTTYGALKNYLPKRPPAALPKEELAALNFLSSLEDGVVLTYPLQLAREVDSRTSPPQPLYLYTSTAYVSAFSGKPVFLEDQGNVDIIGYEPGLRLEELKDFLKTSDEEAARDFLSRNNISYVYWLKEQRALLGESQLGIDKIFENDRVNVYRVKD